MLDDALTLAVMETGVPVWALDADRLEGEVGLRGAERGERLGGGEYAHDLPAGRLVLADDAGPVGVLFGALAPGRGVGPRTTRITLLALQVAGVPDIHVEEALWTVADILDARRVDPGAEPERFARWTTRSRSTPRRCGRPAIAWSTCWSSASPACASGRR